MNDIEEGFRWQTMDGQLLTVQEMETEHIYNCLRMIFNHSIPEPYNDMGFKYYPAIKYWPTERRRQCVMIFIKELSQRDLPRWMKANLFSMKTRIEQYEKDHNTKYIIT